MILEEEVRKILSNAVLKEERGVAATKYDKVVEEIINFCAEYIRPGTPTSQFKTTNGTYILRIPKEITDKFDFIEDLTLIITLSDMGSSEVTDSGDGVTHFKYHHFTNPSDGKLQPISMEVNGFYYNGELLTRTVLHSLYHEINHAYDVWVRKGTKKLGFLTDVQGKLGSVQKMVFSDEKSTNRFFQMIFYRLFIPTEFNALISSVYGDLKGMNSDRANWKADIKNTGAAWTLGWFAKSFEEHLGNASVQVLMDACKAADVDGVSMENPRVFLVTFRQAVDRKLREAWKRIGKTASMWYDAKEDMEVIKNGLTIQ